MEEFIKTSQEKKEFLQCIYALKNSLFKKDEFTKTLIDKTPAKYSDYITRALNGKSDRGSVESLLDQLENKLKKLKEIDLTIAFTPSKSSIEKIYSWVSRNLGVNIVINLNIDPELLAGAIINFNGIYKELSLKKLIETGFLTKKDKINQLLK